MKNQKKAFTLSELLVVVVVLGILSSVAVPKFVRVMETRKTTEAESVLSAVKTEQEARCVAGKAYQTNPAKVSVVKDVKSKNYKFDLKGWGATATRLDKDYSLQMLSYKDGRLCCAGEYCAKLNKDYPPCTGLTRGTDECAGVVSCGGSEPSSSRSCGCLGRGVQRRSVTCDTYDGTWDVGSWGACSIPDACTCDNASKPATSEACGCNNGGTRTRSVNCNTTNGTWDVGSWGRCSASDTCTCDASTKPAESEACGCNNGGTRTRSVDCNTTNGTWDVGSWGRCSASDTCTCNEEAKEPLEQACGCNNTGKKTRTATCNDSNGTWTYSDWSACEGEVCEKECNASTKPAETQACGNGGEKTCTVRCDKTTGEWKQEDCGPCKNGKSCTPGATHPTMVYNCADYCYNDAIGGEAECRGTVPYTCSSDGLSWITEGQIGCTDYAGNYEEWSRTTEETDWDPSASGLEECSGFFDSGLTKCYGGTVTTYRLVGYNDWTSKNKVETTVYVCDYEGEQTSGNFTCIIN